MTGTPSVAGSLVVTVGTTPQLTSSDKAEIVTLCTRAFGEDFSNLFDFVQTADHVLARLDGRLVGHATWATRELQAEGTDLLRTAYVDAVASDPTMWGQGIGSAVMRRLAEETAGYDLRALSTERPDFYSRLGWESWLGPTGVRTEEGVVPTPNEEVMILRTPLTPPLDIHSLLTAEWRGGHPW